MRAEFPRNIFLSPPAAQKHKLLLSLARKQAVFRFFRQAHKKQTDVEFSFTKGDWTHAIYTQSAGLLDGGWRSGICAAWRCADESQHRGRYQAGGRDLFITRVSPRPRHQDDEGSRHPLRQRERVPSALQRHT